MRAILWSLLLLTPFAYGSARTCTDDGQWRNIAPGAWVWSPQGQGDISPRNRGHVRATSVIVHQGEAMVIDPGPSHQHGERTLAWVRCRLKSNVKWVINTHAHAENVLGNSAFSHLQRRGRLDIGASAATFAAMQRRCEQCLAHLKQSLGAGLMRNTRIVLPNRRLTNASVLSVGTRQLQVLLLENAHTESDTVLWDPKQRLAWVGGLVYEGRVPELTQGSLEGWIAALHRLEDLRPLALIGTSVSRATYESTPAGLGYTRRYLESLRTGVLSVLDAGKHASEATEVQLPEYAASAGYTSRHGLNVQRAWREMESIWMNAATPEPSAPDISR